MLGNAEGFGVNSSNGESGATPETTISDNSSTIQTGGGDLHSSKQAPKTPRGRSRSLGFKEQGVADSPIAGRTRVSLRRRSKHVGATSSTSVDESRVVTTIVTKRPLKDIVNDLVEYFRKMEAENDSLFKTAEEFKNWIIELQSYVQQLIIADVHSNTEINELKKDNSLDGEDILKLNIKIEQLKKSYIDVLSSIREQLSVIHNNIGNEGDLKTKIGEVIEFIKGREQSFESAKLPASASREERLVPASCQNDLIIGLRAENAKLLKKYKELEEISNGLQELNNKYDEEIKSFEHINTELQHKLQAQIDENIGLQRSSSELLEEKKAELTQVKEQISAKETELERNKAELERRNEAIKGLTTQITQLKQEADAQVLKVRGELTAKLEESQTEVQRLKNENAQLKQSNADVTAESEQRRVALEQTQARVTELKRNGAASLEAKQAVDAQLAPNAAELAQSDTNNAELNRLLTDANARPKELEKEIRASHDFAFLCLAGAACTILACAAVMRMNNVPLNISKDMLKALPSEMYKIVGEATSALLESGYKAVTEFFRG